MQRDSSSKNFTQIIYFKIISKKTFWEPSRSIMMNYLSVCYRFHCPQTCCERLCDGKPVSLKKIIFTLSKLDTCNISPISGINEDSFETYDMQEDYSLIMRREALI